jgi:hypothetical protein
MSVTYYEGVQLGLPWIRYNSPGPHAPPFVEGFGVQSDIRLMVSRDHGQSWERVGAEPVLSPSGDPSAWDALFLKLADRLVVVEDEVRLYYSAVGLKPNGNSTVQIGLATWERDRFVALRAGEREGVLLTKPLVWPGGRLHVNANAERGTLALEVLGEDGAVLAATDAPLSGNVREAIPSWCSPGSLPSAGEIVRLRFVLREGDLYSFWWG